MTGIIIFILRAIGIVLFVVGVLGAIVAAQLLQQLIGRGLPLALPTILSSLYPVIAGALVYGFAEIISLLRQIRDKTAG